MTINSILRSQICYSKCPEEAESVLMRSIHILSLGEKNGSEEYSLQCFLYLPLLSSS